MIVIAAAFAVGATCTESYARLVAPYNKAIATLIAKTHPWNVTETWKIIEVAVVQDESSHGAVLRLIGDVRRNRDDVMPAARVVTRLQVGDVVETPLVFWTILLLWPVATCRRRLVYLVAGIPVFLCLEAITTAFQLVQSMSAISAMVAGESDPHTVWEHWSGFLEAGGRFAVGTAAALLAVTAVETRRQPSTD